MSITDESETLDLSDVNTVDVDCENSEFPTIAVFVTAVSACVCMISGLIWYLAGDPFSAIVCLISQTVLVSIVIWQACDPFADAAEHIGHVLKLPGSVRGATLDAIASSMPELFTGIIFVVLAVLYGREGVDLQEASGEGFALVIATCAGSAVYNMILIPAICAIFISYYRPSRPTIDVEYRVIVRDGAWFVLMEILLIVFSVAATDRMVDGRCFSSRICSVRNGFVFRRTTISKTNFADRRLDRRWNVRSKSFKCLCRKW